MQKIINNSITQEEGLEEREDGDQVGRQVEMAAGFDLETAIYLVNFHLENWQLPDGCKEE